MGSVTNGRYRSRQEMIDYFKLLAFTYGVQAQREEKPEDSALWRGKSEAYRMAAFELERNLEPNG